VGGLRGLALDAGEAPAELLDRGGGPVAYRELALAAAFGEELGLGRGRGAALIPELPGDDLEEVVDADE
jgi:hypothetical protein